MKLSGGGREDKRCAGVVADNFSLVCEVLERMVREDKDRKRGRAPYAAAFLVIEIVDMVVCDSPERVISM